MSEFKQIDLNQLQKVEVRDNSNQLWEPAYLLQNIKWHDHPYKVLYELTDCEILRDEFKQCRPYKEPTKRPMTWIEYKKFKDKNPHTIFRRFGAKDVFVEGIGNSNAEIDYYEYSLDYGETWHKLEVEDV